MYEVSLIVATDLRILESLQHDIHLILKIHLAYTQLKNQRQVELEVSVVHSQLIPSLVAFLINPLLDFFKLGLIEDGVSEIHILQVRSLVDEKAALKVKLEVLHIQFQLS